MIHYICALQCEASPLIDHYGLKHLHKAGLFRIYHDDEQNISVTVSGVGKLAAAAATSYSYAMLACRRNDVWINLGVAGHRDFAIGGLYLAKRIEDAGSARVWYPEIQIDTAIPGANVLSLDRPSTDYGDALFDMEAAGFIAIACRFATAELVHSIKIISDNAEMPAGKITAGAVTELVHAVLVETAALASQLDVLASEPKSEIDAPDNFQ